MMKEKCARREPHNAQHAVQSLRQHALNLCADKTRGCEVQVRERQHVAFDAAPFFFIESYDHEHRDESKGHRGCRLERSRMNEVETNCHNGPHDKGNGKQPIGKSLLAKALLPEDVGHREKYPCKWKNQWDVDPGESVGRSPKNQHTSCSCRRQAPQPTPSVELGPKKEKDPRGGREKLIELRLHRPSAVNARENVPKTAEGNNCQSSRPIEQIRATPKTVDVTDYRGAYYSDAGIPEWDRLLVGHRFLTSLRDYTPNGNGL